MLSLRVATVRQKRRRKVEEEWREEFCKNSSQAITVRVKIITGSLVILEKLFPNNYRYRYRLEIRMNSFNYHYRYRLGVRIHTFISIGSQLPP